MQRRAAPGMLVAIALAACAKPPPPAPPPAELAVADLSTVAGLWVASDSMDWGYRLTLEAGGRYELRIDRNRLGVCVVKGTLTGAGKAYTLAYAENACARDLSESSVPLAIASYTGRALTLVVGQDRRTFARAPTDQ